MRRGAVRPLLCSALLFLAACTGTPHGPAPVLPPPADASPPVTWQATGRILIVAAEDAGSALMQWRQSGDSSVVSLRGPLGVGALQIESDGSALAVSDGSGQRVDAEAARTLLEARLGAALPIAELRWWMLGLAAPGTPAVIADSAEPPLRTIEQAGWQVGYAEFQRAPDGRAVPARLEASRAGVRLRAVLDNWVLE